jgi:hypothetical protein
VTADEDPNFALVDDPVPPEPDAARLQRAVARGRQRLFRRRAMLGALAASIAFVLIGGGVAVAGRDDSAPDVQVNPPTTVAQTSANVREADANGLHYTMTLTTPTVPVNATVTVALEVENRTETVQVVSTCGVRIYVVPPSDHSILGIGALCNGPGVEIEPSSSHEESVSTTAPATPGRYMVIVDPGEFPRSLAADPFPLQVVGGDGTTTTTTSGPDSSAPLGPSVTYVLTVPTTVGGAVQGEDPRTPHAGDFSGSLTASATSVTVGEGVDVELNIRNTTDHQVHPSLGSLDRSVAIVCASDLSPLGHSGAELLSNVNLFFVTSPALAPGESSGRGGTFMPTSADVGTVTCAGLIVGTTGGWQDGTITGVAQLANVPSVSFTVSAAAPETTAPASADPTTSTTTGSGTP